MAKEKRSDKLTLRRMKRDAENRPQTKTVLRLVGNSPSDKHFTPVSLLFYTKFNNIMSNIIAQNTSLSIAA